jgi:hypothetical protein
MYREWLVVRSQGGYETIDSSYDDFESAQRRADDLDLNHDAVQKAWAFRRDTLAQEWPTRKDLLKGRPIRIPRG